MIFFFFFSFLEFGILFWTIRIRLISISFECLICSKHFSKNSCFINSSTLLLNATPTCIPKNMSERERERELSIWIAQKKVDIKRKSI